MRFDLDSEQEFFRDTTRKFLGSECPLPKVRELRANEAGYEPDFWRQGAFHNVLRTAGSIHHDSEVRTTGKSSKTQKSRSSLQPAVDLIR